jgi:hypothetical protein
LNPPASGAPASAAAPIAPPNTGDGGLLPASHDISSTTLLGLILAMSGLGLFAASLARPGAQG